VEIPLISLITASEQEFSSRLSAHCCSSGFSARFSSATARCKSAAQSFEKAKNQGVVEGERRGEKMQRDVSCTCMIMQLERDFSSILARKNAFVNTLDKRETDCTRDGEKCEELSRLLRRGNNWCKTLEKGERKISRLADFARFLSQEEF
jgi:hypothetical protein